MPRPQRKPRWRCEPAGTAAMPPRTRGSAERGIHRRAQIELAISRGEIFGAALHSDDDDGEYTNSPTAVADTSSAFSVYVVCVVLATAAVLAARRLAAAGSAFGSAFGDRAGRPSLPSVWPRARRHADADAGSVDEYVEFAPGRASSSE